MDYFCQAPLVVGDKHRKITFRAAASKVAAENNFYRVEPRAHARDYVDKAWEEYERELPEAVAALIGGTLTACLWTRVLVPFVAGTLVRGIDFSHRLAARLAVYGDVPLPSDNTNQIRLMELQRLLASVLVADWHVFDAQGPGNLVISDLGFVPSGDVDGSLGVAIPLGLRHILRVHPKQTCAILRHDGSEWRPIIRRTTLNPGAHLDLARLLSFGANRFVFGPDEATVQAQLDDPMVAGSAGPESRLWQLWEPLRVGFMDSVRARVHEFTWHRLVSMLEGQPPKVPLFEEFDFSALSRGWCPPLIFPGNLPSFAPPLAVIGREIVAHLYDVSREELDAIAASMDAARSDRTSAGAPPAENTTGGESVVDPELGSRT
jgi:hypothetical protein